MTLSWLELERTRTGTVSPGEAGVDLGEAGHELSDMMQAEVLCVGHGDPVASGAAKVMEDLVAAG